jgi:phosphohistidine phosphatase
MKSLYVLRHGQAVPETEALSDELRQLTPRGVADVERAAKYLNERGNLPSLVLASSARRAKQTAELCAAALSTPPELSILDSLYLAPPTGYSLALAAHAQRHDRAMLVGHNPGLEALIYKLTDRSEHLATAALVEIELSIAGWAELSSVSRGHGRLVTTFRP